MRTRYEIILPPHYERLSRWYGEKIVKWYREDPRRCLRAGGRGSEYDPVLQGMAKQAEFAAAIFTDQDPGDLGRRGVVKLNWKLPDVGWDIPSPTDSKRIDVKSSEDGKRLMLWSRTVNDKYWEKQFDYLLDVSVNANNWSQCWIEGYLTKKEFFERKFISRRDGDPYPGIERDTWYVFKDSLRDAADLRPEQPEPKVEPIKQCAFCAVCRGAGLYFDGKDAAGNWRYLCNDHRKW